MNHHLSVGGGVALASLLVGIVLSAASGAVLPGFRPSGPGSQAIAHVGSEFPLLQGATDWGERYTYARPPGPVPERLSIARLARPIGAPPSPITIAHESGALMKVPYPYLFASDNYTGDVDIYDATLDFIAERAPAQGGWGVAADREGHVCWGTFNGTIACGLWTHYTWVPTATLNETSGSALGLAFTSNGDLFATNLGSGTIDHWSKVQVAGCGHICNPIQTLNLATIPSPYFLAADGAKLYVEGYDPPFSNVLVGSIDLANSKVKVIQSQPASSFFPGGITFDAAHVLYWDNQYGILYVLPKPWKTATQAYQYSTASNPADFTAITLNYYDSLLFAADDFGCGSSICSLVQEDVIPLGQYSPFNSATNSSSDFYGLAYTLPGKN